ncbi:MAG: RidA family protein [Candidatus Binatia bacterium]
MEVLFSSRISRGRSGRSKLIVLYCAGQTSVDADRNPLHSGDMTAQIHQALDNLETVLGQAGRSWTFYATAHS